MIKKFYLLYKQLLPNSVKRILGKSIILKPIRDAFLRERGVFKLHYVDIHKTFPPFNASFRFYASLKYAINAEKKGVETTLLNQSMALLGEKSIPAHNCVILDIGANFGYLSMVWAKTLAQNGQVYAFETNPDVFKAFRTAIGYNHLQNISLYHQAVGEQEERITMFHLDTSSNVKQTEESATSFEVDMITLDGFIRRSHLKRCDLVKIDVDGIEYDILQGSVDLIERFYPIFVVETNGDHRIPEFFHERGYTLYDLHMHAFEMGSLELPNNIFCLPPR
ncbi:FkbM family methyltransferase [Mangrovimonas sp. AS39]|uniref:FkbM family methyltransferase n=1 Tax=Mangrovimonas futianensis TaxID=2895523 RepID=UPI001E3AE08B|nr:FkbM family methyltransferase [Mangrovimonas futianensis]MCF1191219.1 FkbM family methyltransferase [Mangrovimonas futianensis]MCF1194914.1 FkbM family methyltransferase [Mangrovimonas futianensis]